MPLAQRNVVTYVWLKIDSFVNGIFRPKADRSFQIHTFVSVSCAHASADHWQQNTRARIAKMIMTTALRESASRESLRARYTQKSHPNVIANNGVIKPQMHCQYTKHLLYGRQQRYIYVIKYMYTQRTL